MSSISQQTADTIAREKDRQRRSFTSRLKNHKDVAIWAFSAVVLFLLWHGVVIWNDVSPTVFPAPLAVIRELYENIADGTFIGDLSITLQEVLLGFAGGASVGLVLAALISEVRIARVIIYPYVVGLQSIPKTALAPLFLIWFGFGLESKVALVIIAVFFPVLTNTLSGLERTDPDLIKLMRAYCASQWKIFWRVKLPSALPPIFAGFQIGIVLSMIAAVVAEFIGSMGGIGYRIMMFNTRLDMAGQFAAIIVLSITGFVLHSAIKLLGQKLVFWGKDHR